MLNRTRVTAIGLLAAGLLIAGCDPANTSPVAASSATTAPDAPIVPDFIGMGLQKAQDAAQAEGYDNLTSHDAAGDRMQIIDSNWKVCDQTPAVGSQAPTSVKIDMGAVKTGETCPDVAPTTTRPPTTPPAPKPSPTLTARPATHRPTVAPTHRPSPRPIVTTHHTEPPVDDHGGATALCNDGTLSYSAHHQGTCSHHHGVAVFYK
jgi:hypothetical protein